MIQAWSFREEELKSSDAIAQGNAPRIEWAKKENHAKQGAINTCMGKKQ